MNPKLSGKIIARRDWLGMPDIIIGIGLASLLLNLLSLVFPITLLQIYDRVLPNQAEDTLVLLVLGVLLAIVIEACFKIARSYISIWASARMEHRIGCFAFNKFIHSPLKRYEQAGAGVHQDQLDSLNAIKNLHSGQVITTLIDLPFVFLFLGIIAYVHPYMVPFPMVILCIIPLASLIYGRQISALLAERSKIEDRRMSFIVDVLQGIHTIKSYGMEALILRRYERLQERSVEDHYLINQKSGRSERLGGLLSQLNVVCVVAMGSYLVMIGELTIGGVAACTMLSSRTLQPINRAVGLWSQFQFIQIAREKLREIQTLEEESQPDAPKLPALCETLQLEDIHYQLDDEAMLFSGLKLTLHKGEMIAISGEGSSGKSTLLQVIAGLSRPTSGQVLLDGKDIHQHDLHSFRDKIAYLPQQALLFQGTLLENLTVFRKGKYIKRALAAAQMLGLHEIIERMPEGYQTKLVHDSVDMIPKGIKQQMVIVRALVDNPDIVLFDEANSAMDMQADKRLKAVIERMKGKKTVVLVTHRPSLKNIADRIYDLKDGVLIEQC